MLALQQVLHPAQEMLLASVPPLQLALALQAARVMYPAWVPERPHHLVHRRALAQAPASVHPCMRLQAQPMALVPPQDLLHPRRLASDNRRAQVQGRGLASLRRPLTVLLQGLVMVLL